MRWERRGTGDREGAREKARIEKKGREEDKGEGKHGKGRMRSGGKTQGKNE